MLTPKSVDEVIAAYTPVEHKPEAWR